MRYPLHQLDSPTTITITNFAPSYSGDDFRDHLYYEKGYLYLMRFVTDTETIEELLQGALIREMLKINISTGEIESVLKRSNLLVCGIDDVRGEFYFIDSIILRKEHNGNVYHIRLYYLNWLPLNNLLATPQREIIPFRYANISWDNNLKRFIANLRSIEQLQSLSHRNWFEGNFSGEGYYIIEPVNNN